MQKLRSNPNKLFKAAAAAMILLAIAVSLTAYPLPAQAQASTDATLSALTVSPKNIIGFNSVRFAYDVGVDSTVTEATITATPTDSNAEVSFDSQDSNDVTDGHQVALSAGRNTVTITVTAEDDVTEQEYTVSVNRSVAGDYGWRAQDDLDGLKAERNSTPFGIWTNSTTIWVVSTDGEKAYVYNHDGTRDAAKDFDFDSSHQAATGAWSDGEYVWIADRDDNKLYVYEVATGTRQNSREFDLDTENVGATGVWSDGATIWVADNFVDKVFAYALDGGVRQQDDDIALASANDDGGGIWSDGATIWVSQDLETNPKLFAYVLEGGVRVEDRDFNTLQAAGASRPTGLWSDGETMWVADHTENNAKVYAFNQPPAFAQDQDKPRVTISTSQTRVPEGGQVQMFLHRTGNLSSEMSVRVSESEPFYDGEATATHDLVFPAGSDTFSFTASAQYDGTSLRAGVTDAPQLRATVETQNHYDLGNPHVANVTIVELDTGDTYVTIAAELRGVEYTEIAEGGYTHYTVTRTGLADKELTVNLEVRDPGGFLRGNHWDSDPEVPTQVTFGVDENTSFVHLAAKDDLRDVPNADLAVVLTGGDDAEGGGGVGYWLGAPYAASTTVIDNDDAPALRLVGGLAQGETSVREGEYLTPSVVTYDRSVVDQNVPLGIRVTHNRSWTDPNNPERETTFPLVIKRGTNTVQIPPLLVPDNQQVENRWEYTLSIGPYSNAVPADEVSQYFSTPEGSSKTISIEDASGVRNRISIATRQTRLQEGGTVDFTVSRSGRTTSAVTVRIRVFEPNHPDKTATSNPTEQYLEVTIPAKANTARLSVTASAEGTPTGGERHYLLAEVSPPSAAGYDRGQYPSAEVDITGANSDDAYVTVSASQANVAEGSDATFTFTRTGPLAAALTVSIEVDDPVAVLRGNHWIEYPDVPSQVTFPADSATVTQDFATAHDQRETGDAPLMVAVAGGNAGDEIGDGGYWVGNPSSATTTVTDDDTAPEISLSVAPENIREGQSFTVTATRSGHVAGRDTRLRLRLSHNRVWDDPDGPPRDIIYPFRFRGNETEKTMSFTVNDNNSRERREGSADWTYTFSLEPPKSVPETATRQYWSVDGDGTARVTATDEGLPDVSVRALDESVVEDGTDTATFEFTRSGNVAEVLYFYASTTEPNHPQSNTIQNPSSRGHILIFPEGSRTLQLVVTPDDDGVVETDDYLLAQVGPLFDRDAQRELYGVGEPDQARIPILNPTTTVTIAPGSTPIEEGETASYTLSREGHTASELTVNVSVSDPGHFLRGESWESAPSLPTQVTFAAGSATATLELQTIDDRGDVPSNNITVTVRDREGQAFSIGTPGSAAVRVNDNDVRPQISLHVNNAQLTEGETAIVTLTRSGNSENPVLLSLDFEPGIAKGSIYTVPAGETTVEIRIASEHDEEDEPDVTYRVTLNNTGEGSHYDVSGPRTLEFTFEDDDLPVVSVRALADSYDEGQYAWLEWTRVGRRDVPLTLNLRTAQTGHVVDETLNEFLGDFTLEFDVGSTTKYLSYYLPESDGDEPDDTFYFQLRESDDYRIDAELAAGSFEVRDGDPTPVLRAPEVAEVSESDQTITYQVSLDSPATPASRRMVTVEYRTEAANAEAGTDYRSTSGTLTFRPEQESATISIPILEDQLAEYQERFNLILIKPVGVEFPDGAEEFSGTVTIVDNEPTVIVAAVGREVEEGNPAQFRFTRVGDTTNPVEIHFHFGYDGQWPRTQTVVIPAEQETFTWSFLTVDDDLGGGQQDFLVWLLPPEWLGHTSGYHTDTERNLARVTVTENDEIIVTIQGDSDGVVEGNAAAFTLTRTGHLRQALTVNVTVTREGDYFPSASPPGTVTFASGSATASLSVPTVNDGTTETSDGSTTANITNGTGYRPGSPDSDRIFIIDNDRNLQAVFFARTTDAVNEGDEAVFHLQRTGPGVNQALEVTVDVEERRNPGIWEGVTEKQAEYANLSKGIFAESSHTLTFAAGESTATLTFATEDESYNDGNSYFRAELPYVAGSVYLNSAGNHIARVWVRDDDIPTITVLPEILEHTESPQEEFAQYTVHRTGDVSTVFSFDALWYQTLHWPGEVKGTVRTGAGGEYGRSIPAGQASHMVNMHPNEVPVGGGEGDLELLARICPEVTGSCSTHQQYRVGDAKTVHLTVHNTYQGIRLTRDQEEVAEGDKASFTLTRYGSFPEARRTALTVAVQVTQDGEFIDGVPPETVRFPGHPDVPGDDAENTYKLEILTVDDELFEGDGSITVTVVLYDNPDPLATRYELEEGDPVVATVAVNDNDLPRVSIADVEANEDDGALEFTITTQAHEGNITVDWATADGEGDLAAVAGEDYTAANDRITFEPGQTSKTLRIATLPDAVHEGDETFTVTLSNPVEADLGTATATGTILNDDLPVLVNLRSRHVSPQGGMGEVVEGDVVFTTVWRGVGQDDTLLSSITAEDLTVNLEVTQVGDYLSGHFVGDVFTTGLPTSVIIPAGRLSTLLVIQTTDDSSVEADGSVTVALVEGPGYAFGSTPSVTTTVLDNDGTVSIADATGSEGMVSGKVEFTVTLSHSLEETASLTVKTVDGTATSTSATTPTSLGQDFVAKRERLTFAPGETSKMFTVEVVNDSFDEPDPEEEFTVRLTNPSPNITIEDGEATGKIEDNDRMLLVALGGLKVTASENQGRPVSLVLLLTPADNSFTTSIEGESTIDWELIPGTALEGKDYEAASGVTTIPMGATEATAEITLIDDQEFEAAKEVLYFDLIGGSQTEVKQTRKRASIDIEDDETMEATVAADAESVAEGDIATYTVTLSGAVSTGETVVTYETGGTAGENDYTAPSASITILAEETTGTISILTLVDSEHDPDETLTVTLTGAESNDRQMQYTDHVATTTLLEGDIQTASVKFVRAQEEGQDLTFSVDLSEAAESDVTVKLRTEEATGQANAAEENSDYTPATGTYTLKEGNSKLEVTVPTVNDNLVEGDEVVRLVLSEATREVDGQPESLILGITTATGTILDNDEPPTALTLTISPASGAEDAGMASLTVTGTLDGDSVLAGDLSVALTVEDGTATVNDDYTAQTGSLTISAGSNSGTATLEVTPVDDDLYEGDETVSIVGSVEDITVTPATFTITDDESVPTGVVLTVNTRSVREGDGEQALSVSGTLQGSSVLAEDTEVTLAVEGVSLPAEEEGDDPTVAATSDDYSFTGVTLIIPAGRTTGTATLDLTPTDDIVAEGSETMQVAGRAGGLSVTPAVLTLQDNDQEPSQVRLTVKPKTLDEGAGSTSLEVTATFDGGTARLAATIVDLSIYDVSATVNTDYEAGTPGPLAISAGELSGTSTVLLTIVDDGYFEGDEDIAIRGANTDPGLPVSGVRVSITDNDASSDVIRLSLDRDTINEGDGQQRLMVTATLGGVASRVADTVVQLSLADGTAVADDYTGQAGYLTIPTGSQEGTGTVLVTVTDDEIDEGDETLEVRGEVSGQAFNFTPATITIVDDDERGVVFSADQVVIGEGRDYIYTVALDTQPTQDVTVTVNNPTDNLEVTATPRSLTFTTENWNTPQTVTVSADHDGDAVDDSATVTHGVSGGGYDGVTVPDVAVTVTDDETLGVVISPTAIAVQAGGGNTYSVVLGSQPAGDVTVTVSGQAGTDLSLGGLSPTNTLTFSTGNWDTVREVTVGAAEDAGAGEVTLSHGVSSADDLEYAALNADDVVVTVIPMTPDTPILQLGVAVSDLKLTVPEGGSNTYTIVLSHQPSGDATVTVNNPTDNLEVTATPRSLTFTTENWDEPQAVMVAAVQDGDALDDSATVTHGVSGGGYGDVSAPDVAVTVTDDDRGIVLDPTTLTVVEGDATGQSYTVKLAAQPTVDVTVTVTGQDQTDLELTGLGEGDTLTFTTSTWDDAQTVTVQAREDTDAANDKVTLTHTAARGEYAGTTAELAVTVTDDDRGIVLDPTTLTVVEGDATGQSYTVKLATQPTVDVTVTVTGQDQTDLELTGLGEGDTLTFSTTSWDDAQTVTVQAGEDTDAANEKVTLTHTAARGEYAGTTAELAVTVTDDETLGVVISPTAIAVQAGGGNTYSVVLGSQPAGDVTVTVSGQAGTDLSLGGLSPTNTLTFSTGNWDTVREVTVGAAEDAGAGEVTLSHGVSSADDLEYAALNADDVVVTVIPMTPDTPILQLGVAVSDLKLTVPEGGSNTYTIVLSHQPSGDATVTVNNPTDNLEVTATPRSLTFTTENWDEPQAVMVAAVQDGDALDDSATVTHGVSGGGYGDVSAPDVAVTVTDDDRGIVLDPTTLTVVEGDATGQSYTVKLAAQPTVDVTVTVTGQDQTDLELTGLGEGDTLTFTTSTWDDAQTVTVQAREDTDAANDKVTLTHTAARGEYAGTTAELAVTVTDDDRGIVLDPTTLTVVEGDATGQSYTVKLATQPTVDVTVTVTGQDQTDLELTGLGEGDTLTFSTTSWDDAQTVTVQAGEDTDAANEKVTLTHTAARGEYAGTTAELAVTVTDDETLGVVISPTAIAVQAGGGNTYSVVLGSQPAGDVTVTVSGQAGTDLSLGGLSPTNTLTFSTGNWDTVREVTVGAAEDAGAGEVTLSHGVSSADDLEYAALNADDVVVTVIPMTPDTPILQLGVAVSDLKLTVPEGGSNTYTIVLSHQPSGDATVTVNNPTDNLEVTATPRSLTFTTENWDEPQAVMVAAVQDGDALDDSATVTHGVSGGGYGDVSAPDVAVTVTDDDRGIVLDPTTLTVVEGDATGQSYTVKLAAQPTVDVTVTVTGQDQTDLELTGLGEGDTLTFTTSTWDDAQTVTVQAREDTDAANDKVTLTHTAARGEYAGTTAELAVTVTDDDRGIVLDPTTLTVVEGDATGQSYTVKLATQPTVDVTVTVTGQDQTDLELTGLGEGDTLTFSTTSWDDAQTVTVQAGEDTDAANEKVTLTHTAARGEYAGTTAELAVTVTDDETLGVVISPTAIAVQAGGGNTYSVVLGSQPAGDVTVTVSGQAGTDLSLGGLSPTNTLTFSTGNWDTVREVTVGAAEDAGAGEVTLSHGVSSADDLEYAALNADDVVVTVIPMTPDTPILQLGVAVSDLKLTVPEGGSNTYTIVLSHQPSGDATVTVNNPTDNLEVTATPRSLTFTTENWDEPQAVMVAAVQDGDALDDSATVTHGVSGGGYGDVSAPDVAVTVTDDDRGIVLDPTTLTVVEGDATGQSYTVKLAAQPTVDVTVTVTGQDQTDLELTGLGEGDTLTFTTSTWDDAQTVTVQAREDTDAANDKVTLTHTAARGEYAGTTAELAVTVTDDDRGIVLDPTTLTVVEGDATGQSYTVKLATQPTVDVTVTVTGQDQTDLELTGLGEGDTLTFSTTSWDDAQTVTVQAGEDTDAANEKVTLTHTAARGEYAGTTAELAVTVTDDETLGVVISPTAIAVQAGGGNTYSVVLGSQPAGDVTVTVSGQAGTDLSLGGLSPTNTLTFSTGNWDTVREVTVGAAEDAGAGEVTLSHGVSSADDLEYAALNADDVVVTVIPMTPDTPILQLGVAVSDLKLTVPEGGSNTYTIVLSHQPSGDATVTVNNPTDNLEVTATPRSLTFTTENWDEPQAVMVAAVQDGDALDDSATVTHGVSGGGYGDVSAPDVAVTVTDDDRGIVLDPTTLTVVEGDATGQSYTVKLAAQPTVDVTVTVTGQDQTDLELTGLGEGDTLTFTTSTWDDAQTVTVQAREDTDAANDKVTLTHTAARGEYAGTTAELAVTVTDDDRGIVLDPTTLTVVEGDATGQSYTVKLATQPTVDVTVTVTGQDQTDLELTGLGEGDTLTFSTTSWDDAQTVTVQAGEDTDAANEKVTLTHTAARGEYAGTTAELAVTVTDDETLGVVISPTAIAVQAGGGNTYSVVLGSQPAGDVTVTVSGQAGTDLSLGGLSPTNTLTFSTGNWDTVREVTVGAAEDAGAGEVTLSHGVSSADDLEYAALNADDVVVTVIPMTPDTPILQLGVAVSDLKLTVPEGGSNTYTIVLSHQPSGDATVTVNNPTDNLEVTATPRSLTFTTENWDEPQAVMVAAVQDGDALDDSATVTHGVSGGGYGDVSAPDVAVTVTDDDRGIVLDPTTLTVVEGDATGQSYTVKLAAQPTVDVTVTVTGQDQTDLELTGLGEGDTLTFTTSTWDDAQTVTVQAREDTDAANDKVTLTHTAARGEYAGTTAELAVTVTDDDRGIVLDPTTLTVVEGDATGQSYTVKLATQPTVDVTVTVTGQDQTDLELTGLGEGDTLTFSTTSWDDAQTVTVQAGEDTDAANEKVTLTHTAARGEYAGTTAELAVTVTDDETLGVVISPTAIAVQAGGGNTYSVVLGSQPAGDVTVTVSGQAGTDLSLGGLSPTNTLTFSTGNWDTVREVTVGAAEDAGAGEVTLSHGVSSADDLEYAALNADDVVVTVIPMTPDTPILQLGVAVSDLKLTVPEGGSNTYTIVLSHQPSGDATVTVNNPTDNLEVTATPRSLTFTTENWDEPQAVMVAAVQDGDALDDSATVTHGVSGGGYGDVSAPDVAVTVTDDDRGIVLDPTTLTVVEGDATGQSYTVKLAAQPTVDVTVTVTGQDQTDLELTGLGEGDTLTFTTSTWDDAQTVTVQAREDTDAANDKVTLTHTAARGEYAGTTAELAVTVTDDDRIDQATLLESVRVRFTNAATAIPEGGTVTVIVSLTEALTQDVTIPLTRTNQAGAGDADYSGVPASLAFGSGDTQQSFTFSATVDSEDEDEEQVVLGFGTLPEGVAQGTVSQATITILDVPSVSFGASGYSATEGGENAVVTVRLSEARPEDLTVPLTVQGGGGATPEDWSGVPAAVTFSAGQTSKTFTVVAVDDTAEDDDEMVHLGFGSLPSGFNAGPIASATVTLMNDETMDSCVGSKIWCATITLEGWITDPPYETYHIAVWDRGLPEWAETEREFTYGGVTYAVSAVMLHPDPRQIRYGGDSSTFRLSFREDHMYSPPSEDHIAQWRLHVGDIQLEFEDAIARLGDGAYIWAGAGFRPISKGGTNLTLRIERTEENAHVYTPVASNSRPTGELIVTGKARVGSTLTMDASGISDPDGKVHSDFRYTWWVVYASYSGSNHQDDGTMYTVEPELEGLRIQGLVTFTDDKGNREAVISAMTPIICAIDGEIEPCEATVPQDVGNAPPENSPATGKPAIAGTARVGEILSATTSDIADPDGLTSATFSYQWARDEGSASTDISDATASTYTLQEEDLDRQVSVTVSFTDDTGYQETLISDSVYVQPPSPLYGGFDSTTLPSEHDGSNTFTLEIHFSEEPALGFEAVREYVLDVTNGDVTSVRRTTQGSNIRWEITVQPDGNDEVTLVLPITTDCDDQGAVCTRSEKMLSNKSSVTIAGPPETAQQVQPENSPATSAPTIGGSAQVGETLTADTSGIADADGLDDATFSFQWVAGGSDISGATGSTYTLTASDQGQTVQVRVSFTDDAGNEETLTSVATASVAARPNSPATGAPTISGTMRVGETVAAGTTGIADADGLDNASFSYQWVRSDGVTDSDIPGETGATYEVAPGDVGKTIKVRVSFTDDAGNEETTTSAATAAVAATFPGTPRSLKVQTAGTGELAVTWQQPQSNGGSDVTGYRVQWKLAAGSWDTEADVSSATATGTSHNITGLSLDTEYAVRVIATNTVGDGPPSAEETETARAQTSEQQDSTPNTAATGAPTISGTAQVGETLTADTSEIADEDGLDNASFDYQWLADDTAISGATGATYTLAAADEGKTIKVYVSFTDDNSNEESLTSVATGAVAAAPPTNNGATGAPTIGGTVKVGQVLTADITGIADQDGLDNASFDYQWLADGTAISGATNSAYLLVADDEGKAITVRVSFTDDNSNDESLSSAATAAVTTSPLTVGLENEPDTPHDGQNTFTFELRFSEEFYVSYLTLRDDAFAVDGGEVTNARRMDPDSITRNIHWEITVRPTGDGDVTITLPETTDCDAAGAICTEDDRMLSNEVEFAVSGPGQ